MSKIRGKRPKITQNYQQTVEKLKIRQKCRNTAI